MRRNARLMVGAIYAVSFFISFLAVWTLSGHALIESASLAITVAITVFVFWNVAVVLLGRRSHI